MLLIRSYFIGPIFNLQTAALKDIEPTERPNGKTESNF